MKLFLLGLTAAVLTVSCASFKPASPAAANSSQPEVVKAETPTPGGSAANGPELKRETPIQPRGLDYGATIKLVSFGSSSNQDLPQPIWKALITHDPDIFLFMGDTVQTLKPEQKPVAEQFRKLNRIPEYRAFREKIPFLATWNDQDYGQHNGGADFAGKDATKKEFLRNWTYIRDSIAMGQAGIYHAKIIGPKKKQVQFIMLDTRSFRSPLTQKENEANSTVAISPNTDAKATILGEDQWAWLEDQLKRPAEVRFIVTSIPLVATEHGVEKWSNFPKDRQRFFDLLKRVHARNVIVLSGGRRQGSIAKTGLKDWGTLYDVTASPITEPAESAEVDSSFEGKSFNVENFGLAQIDWPGKRITLQIRDKDNKILTSTSIKLQ